MLIQDVWLSSDGTGAAWTLQTATAPMAGFADGALTFMYDSTTAGNGGTAAIATLVLYNSGDNNVYRSSDYGRTWTAPIPATFSAGGGVRLVADLRGWLYLLGGSTDGPAVYFSTDTGATWQLVNQQAFNPNITGAVTVTQSTYGCAALTYRAAASSTTGYHQAIVLYGGTMYSQQNIKRRLPVRHHHHPGYPDLRRRRAPLPRRELRGASAVDAVHLQRHPACHLPRP